MTISKSDSKINWRKKAREYLALAFGGRCAVCGYDKCLACFDYHHVDASQKDDSLSKAMSNGYAWAKIVQEARKCALVCCRCHREIHAGVTELPDDYQRFNEEYVDVIKLRRKEYDFCPVCSDGKPKRQPFCSIECFSHSQKRFDISKDELEIMMQQMPYEKIGSLYGVTGAAIRKRAKALGIRLSDRRGYWAKRYAGK